MDYLDKPDPQTFIAHHGIKGQKWGVRRFQNEDGSLTKAGKERYNEQNSPNSSDNSDTLCRLDDKDLNLDLLRRWVKNS